MLRVLIAYCFFAVHDVCVHTGWCRTIYNMCTQKPPHDYSEQLYGLYKEAFNKYINDKVGHKRSHALIVACLGLLCCVLLGAKRSGEPLLSSRCRLAPGDAFTAGAP